VYAKEFGYSDIQRKSPLKRNDVFRIYSMTKPVTAVAAMMLYEEGKFMLWDPVSKYIPEFKDFKVFDSFENGVMRTVECKREITIRDILRQTSGLGNGWEKGPTRESYAKNEPIGPDTTLEDAMKKLPSSVPLCFQPGTAWKYGSSIDVLGRLVEIWSGKPLDEFFRERILGPLNMNDTTFYIESDKLGRFTDLYLWSKDTGLTECPKKDAYDAYMPDKNKFLSGGGNPGLLSTASDYLRFCQMLINGGILDETRLLNPRTVRLMATNALPECVSMDWPPNWVKMDGYGYGFAVSVRVDNAKSQALGSIGDFGWDGAASTWFSIDPKEDLIILFLTQTKHCDTEIQVKLKTLVYQAMLQ
jgi:CubicO group peptidase (beta-lactamase class C family)